MQSVAGATRAVNSEPQKALVRVESAAEVSWKTLLAEAVRSRAELFELLGLPADRLGGSDAEGGFPLLVPRGFVERMRPGDPQDPLLLQVLPQAAEREEVAGYVADPLAEREQLAAPAVVRKYAGRALLLAASGCGVNCRYCFRRSFPYDEAGVSRAGLQRGLEAIAADSAINEVILSGGDPLLLDDERLAELLGRLEEIPHLRRLRIHSRMPVVLPERVTERLVRLLAECRLRGVVVIHANHPAELTGGVPAAMRQLAAAGSLLFNQAVLLAGVNDSVEVLVGLSERLLEIGVVPYYLHMLDPVRGAAHFAVDERRARGLHAAVLARLPGYAVPRLVRELPGEPSKTWLAGP